MNALKFLLISLSEFDSCVKVVFRDYLIARHIKAVFEELRAQNTKLHIE